MTASSRTGRVLHAVSEYGAVSETFIVDRIVELERLGWEAWVSTATLSEGARPDRPDPRRVFVPSLPARVGARLRALPERQPAEGWWLASPLARVSPDVVHAHFGWTAREALSVTQEAEVPLVAGFHGYDATVYPRWGFDVLDRPLGLQADPTGTYVELFAGAAAILATSAFIAGKLKELGCDREVTVVRSGIRLNCFPYRPPRPDPADCRLVFVGRLIPYKGLDLAIRALAAVVGEGVDARLEVVGEGRSRAEARQLAGTLEVSERVRFSGALDRRGVLEALRRADILVAPSRTSRAGQAEGLSNAVKEALAVGLPAVASDSGGLPEVTPPSLRDELVPEGDWEAVAGRILALWRRRAGWPERTQRSRRWVEENFDWRRAAPAIADVYRRAAGGEDPAG